MFFRFNYFYQRYDSSATLMKERDADPTLKSKEEFFRMIDEAKNGPSKRFANVEELDRSISSL